MARLVIWLALVGALLVQEVPAKPPATEADVGAWDAAIVRRAAGLIPTLTQWDRSSTGECPAHAASVSLFCALQQAADEAGANQPAISDCRFHPTSGGWKGNCGPLLGDAPIFSVTRAAAVTTACGAGTRHLARSGLPRWPTPYRRFAEAIARIK